MTPYQKLLEATAEERATLLCLPFIRDGARGRLSVDDYRAFLREAYHHVKHTLPLLMACGARLSADREWLREAMAEYIEEETGHQEWILNDLRACGVDPEPIRHGRTSAETELMVAYAYDGIARGNPLSFLGMVLVLEGTSVAVASEAAEALRIALHLPPAAFTYLTSHGALDQAHTRFYQTLVDRLDEDDLDVVIHAARMFYRLYGDIFRGLDRARLSGRKEAA